MFYFLIILFSFSFSFSSSLSLFLSFSLSFPFHFLPLTPPFSSTLFSASHYTGSNTNWGAYLTFSRKVNENSEMETEKELVFSSTTYTSGFFCLFVSLKIIYSFLPPPCKHTLEGKGVFSYLPKGSKADSSVPVTAQLMKSLPFSPPSLSPLSHTYFLHLFLYHCYYPPSPLSSLSLLLPTGEALGHLKQIIYQKRHSLLKWFTAADTDHNNNLPVDVFIEGLETTLNLSDVRYLSSYLNFFFFLKRHIHLTAAQNPLHFFLTSPPL